jgi:hypothetical protein
MVTWTPADVLAFALRVKPKDKPLRGEAQHGASREIKDLHEPILRWARSQIPFVPVFYTRPDKASGAFPGTPDFAILYKRQCILIECKTRIGKIRPEQTAWGIAAAGQGFQVHIVRSLSEFSSLIERADQIERAVASCS